MEGLSLRLTAIVLASLRIGPTLAFAPPFTLLRVPVQFRVLLSLGFAVALTGAIPPNRLALIGARSVLSLATGELAVGIAIAVALQIAFAAILFAGRAIDIQAGFGFAALADPTTEADMPLGGTIFAYAAGLIFFTGGGPYQLMALWRVSLITLPLGFGAVGGDPHPLEVLLGGTFGIALGMFGLLMLVLFLLDLAIAFMSRTLPQMNMLVLGFQVKPIAMLLVLPVALGISASLMRRLLDLALEAAPALLGGRG